MPAVSRAQQIAMAIAEHNPSKLNPENRGMLSMSHQQLHDFASTPRKGLPQHSGGKRGFRSYGQHMATKRRQFQPHRPAKPSMNDHDADDKFQPGRPHMRPAPTRASRMAKLPSETSQDQSYFP